MSEEEKKELVQFILDKREEGKVVFVGLEGLMSTPLENIIQQPTDGLLYDLNRLEETTLTFIDDPKWINDFAVALVIRKLKADLAERTDMLETLIGNIDTLFDAYPEKLPLEDAMRHWQRCAQEVLAKD